MDRIPKECTRLRWSRILQRRLGIVPASHFADADRSEGIIGDGLRVGDDGQRLEGIRWCLGFHQGEPIGRTPLPA
jgi:hypothetical protein